MLRKRFLIKIFMPKGPEQYAPPENEEKIDLHDLLTHDNPNLSLYQELMRQEYTASGEVSLPQQIGHAWLNLFFDITGKTKEGDLSQEGMKYFKEKLQNGLLIDIGGGAGQLMEAVAKKFGVDKYVNVDICIGKPRDPYTGYIRTEKDFSLLSEEERKQPMQGFDVSADMLDFVARIPNNSASFVINGIDMYVLRTEEYRKALFNEIMRATKMGGILFGVGSDIWYKDARLRSMAEQLGFDSMWDREKEVFEKVKE